MKRNRTELKPGSWLKCNRKNNSLQSSGELRNGALQISWVVVCFSRDFTFRIKILIWYPTSNKYSFSIITNVLSLARDLPHPFLTFYFNPKLLK